MANEPTLIVITGATASGKSALAIDLAQHLNCEIISADSRQIYRDIPIGTAAPTASQLAAVPHHLVGTLALDAYYSAAQFEADALAIANRLWQQSPHVIVCGGSMMYIDALTDGIDMLPTISEATRARVLQMLQQQGLDALLAYLEILDPEYYAIVDHANTRRVVHAIEICLEAGKPYSQLRVKHHQPRPFRIVKVAIDMPRAQLFDRINRRVDIMMEEGLLEEAHRVYPLRHLNALNTVGFKELFAYFDGTMDLSTATARIAKNTRVYAKKQLTWLARPGVRPTTFLPADNALQTLIAML